MSKLKENKKGVELTLETVVVLIIMLIVLIVMIVFFADKYLGGSDAIYKVGSDAIEAGKNS